jgi:nitroreductase
MADEYQERYAAHQLKKKETLFQIIMERHSDRVYSDQPVEESLINGLIEAIDKCPTSCNRKAISIRSVSDRDRKSLLGGLLVGGIGWIHRASHVLLIFADPLAYKAGDEIKYMPYLDAGAALHQIYLCCAAFGLKCCFANPNIRDFNKDHFEKVFGSGLFCGAMAIGHEYKKEEK